MKLSVIASAFALAGATLAAQTQAPTGAKVTVAGCVQRAQRNGSVGGTVVGTSAAPNTADDEANSGVLVDAFLLTQASTVVDGNPEPAPQATRGTDQGGTTAGTAGRTEFTTYGLQGREAELERHQGARIEVTGTVEPPAASGRGTGGAATASGAKRLKVESFKVLADRCETRP